MILCESAIDALSYAALFPQEGARYGSFAGQISPAQRECIRATAARMPVKSKIVAATDIDSQGGTLAEIIREAVELTGRDDLTHVVHRPVGFKDWNDQLRKRPLRYLPPRPREPVIV